MICEHNNSVGRVDLVFNGKKIGESYRCSICGKTSNDILKVPEARGYSPLWESNV